MISLAVPLSMTQIEAANKLHRQLGQWQATDSALRALHQRFPEFDAEATLLKVVAINQLYGTNVYAVVRMAKHITEVFSKVDIVADVDLVDQLASFSGRKHISFASKFAHFFIDVERFPIYDSYVRDMITYHLGRKGQVSDTSRPYTAFVENLARLKERAQFSCTTRELDHYLWLAGLYKAWLKNHAVQINTEVATLFKLLSAKATDELAILLSENIRLTVPDAT